MEATLSLTLFTLNSLCSTTTIRSPADKSSERSKCGVALEEVARGHQPSLGRSDKLMRVTTGSHARL
jgi:hypothetical protein